MLTTTTNGAELGDSTADESSRPWYHGPLGYRAVLELLLCGSGFLLYRYIRTLTKNDTVEAYNNARRVMHFEQAFGVFNEVDLQRALLGSRGIILALNRYYVMVHFTATVLFLVWAYARHQRYYAVIRNIFLIVTGAALAIHVAVPLAPPRMFPSTGFVDTLQQFGPRIYPTDISKSVANQFAAVPSLHFGWAVLVAGGIVAIKRNRRSMIAFIHPFLTLIAIVATGNHYWFDAAVALVLIVATFCGYLLVRSRRTVCERTAAALRFLRHAVL
jgi:hypothetical protein